MGNYDACPGCLLRIPTGIMRICDAKRFCTTSRIFNFDYLSCSMVDDFEVYAEVFFIFNDCSKVL